MNLLVICRFSSGDHLSGANGRRSVSTLSRLSSTCGAIEIPVNSRMARLFCHVMARVRVIHWKPAEAGRLVDACRACGHEVEFDAADFPEVWRKIRQTPPDALVIDLTCKPSHGREVAISMRQRKDTRRVPI